MSLFRKLSDILAKVGKAIFPEQDFITVLRFLFVNIIVYGLILNYVAFVLLGLDFTFYTFPAYGFFWLILSQELPFVLGQYSRAVR